MTDIDKLIADARFARGAYPLDSETVALIDRAADALFEMRDELAEAYAAIAGSPEKAKRLASLVASSTRLVQIERDDARAERDRLRGIVDQVRGIVPSGVLNRLDEHSGEPLRHIIRAVRAAVDKPADAPTEAAPELEGQTDAPTEVGTPAERDDPGAHGGPIPRYAMLEVWMALYGHVTSGAFDTFYDAHGYADTWATLCSAIRVRAGEPSPVQVTEEMVERGITGYLEAEAGEEGELVDWLGTGSSWPTTASKRQTLRPYIQATLTAALNPSEEKSR
ncbi:hypothetical protein N8K70_03850 [Microbacterium betulae]|uniref:Uncharacterized protein n=1 Tax=Microbacterium betulae TaxID=2981139 RepID=A0AA97FJF0_9MICO|nr:hypothetical protein [Microbacterium sp. AB]WOF23824.1 hypothetical protein N8K70_03850 [Microbacterium sp. AB]